MRTPTAGVPILMYHSISDEGPGPVAIRPATFRDQMSALADAGATAISVTEYVESRTLGRAMSPGSVVLTFDDGYRDFLDTAFPVLQVRGWRCTVFLPVTPMDDGRPWHGGDGFPRPLLRWTDASELSRTGVEFGAHSMTHQDLTRLPLAAATDEIARSARHISERAGCSVEGFAPPFGRSTPAIREEVARHYRWSVGTRMDRACEASDIFDLPRIEMWYFRDIGRWRRYVANGWTPYFEARRALRAIKEAL